MQLEQLKNTSRPYKRRKLLGRGVGCKLGKTCGRGTKGAGARSGWRMRAGFIGGAAPLHRRLPTRGFSNVRFSVRYDVINLDTIEKLFQAGEKVNVESLFQKGIVSRHSPGIKVLGNGVLKKKVVFEVAAISKQAQEKLKEAGIPF